MDEEIIHTIIAMKLRECQLLTIAEYLTNKEDKECNTFSELVDLEMPYSLTDDLISNLKRLELLKFTPKEKLEETKGDGNG